MKENRTLSDNLIDGMFFAIATVIVFLSLYPLYFIVIASLSDPMKVITGNVWFLIRGFYTKGYELVFADSRIWTGYRNTLVYTSLGAIVSLLMTIPAGYALSRRESVRQKSYHAHLYFYNVFQRRTHSDISAHQGLRHDQHIMGYDHPALGQCIQPDYYPNILPKHCPSRTA